MPNAKAVNRRRFLKTSSAAGLALGSGLLAAPALAQTRTVKIGSYGGFFEDSFKASIFPEFEAATGIKVQSVTQPDSSGWLLTMHQAIQAGSIPTDLSLHVPMSVIKGDRMNTVFDALDPKKIPNLSNVSDGFLNMTQDGLKGIGAFSYYSSLVVNTDEVDAPTSWTELWDVDRFQASLGFPSELASPLLDITAVVFFGGPEILKTREGIQTVVDKIGEMNPNIALWYSSTSQMEQSLKNNDVIGGMLYHDVAGLLASDGVPLASIFPKEGNPVDFNSWTLSRGSENIDESHEFINFCCQPEIQALQSRAIGVAPVVDVATTDLTEDEVSAVAGTPSFPMSYDVLLNEESFIDEAFKRMRSNS
ncbi:PotD/PotF family extracellular solute-binding protein [Cognatishimia sp. 1_MG-2023]|uniref:ABC transporter substrate-binding protein n=1 Tax=Cognatishimia sp. 1_MG-2023 TaxID=3062642 RepID=UPI0026E338BA|nr:PotD/PotF family extracellular solute-binding protein [Cognatishimia sp. 1_MG-2023]MDO6728269.1 PotD/PotF family extracellular solute-binding protein [Cognatishimia sp. 1_MG-2023]